MRTKRNSRGFTMAEMLIVVAIISVLGAVGFIAVQNHQRNMAFLERNTIAKEIFIAAQNHLTMADSQGFMGVDMQAETIPVDDGKGVYCLCNTSDSVNTAALNIMLPFGSIDETVRAGGGYIIRYQIKPARVLDVFYWTRSGRFSIKFDLPDNLLDYQDESKRRPTIGWYGGENVESSGEYKLNAPQIIVDNAERLTVKVTDTNYYTLGDLYPSLKLIITGSESKAQASILLTHYSGGTMGLMQPLQREGNRLMVLNDDRDKKIIEYTIILDDITTKGMHFADIGKNNEVTDLSVEFEGDIRFDPGEDIVVKAVAFSNERLSNIAYSSEITTNSLFEEIVLGADENTYIASISNIRHLENLDNNISNLAYDAAKLKITSARQIVDLVQPPIGEGNDLSWLGFLKAIDPVNGKAKIYGYNETGEDSGTKEGCYRPISPNYPLTYDGQGHSIANVNIDYIGNAGLLGTVMAGSTISNLALIDFKVKGTDNAGILAGLIESDDDNLYTVSNVLAYNSEATDMTASDPIIDVFATGNAGGLVGSMVGGTVHKSAAAVIVSGANAGGLIGSVSGTTVSASYSGGHTIDAEYYYRDGDDNPIAIYNVLGKSNAGGLIGVVDDTTIKNCYSTCSASYSNDNGMSGGFIGICNSKGATISGSYCTGLVNGEGDNAFIGDGFENLSIEKDCYYYSIINERIRDDTTSSSSLKALDASIDSYGVFVKAPDEMEYANAYDDRLIELFGDNYGLLTVVQLYELNPDSTVSFTADDFVVKHFGDWPSPETLVVNVAE